MPAPNRHRRIAADGPDLAVRFATEFRVARRTAGLTQRQLAARIGCSQTMVSAVESGRRQPSWALASTMARGVGHDLSLRLFPNRSVPLRDSGQLAFANVISAEAHQSWHAELEAPIRAGDLRAADLLLRGPDELIHSEIERRLVDFQAQLRSAQLKRRDLAEQHRRPVRLVIAVPDNRAARDVLAKYQGVIRRSLPATSHQIWRAIRYGGVLGSDGILRVKLPPA